MIAEPGVLRGPTARQTWSSWPVTSRLPEAALGRVTAGDPFPARVVAGEELRRFVGKAPAVTDAGTAGADSGDAASADASAQSTSW